MKRKSKPNYTPLEKDPNSRRSFKHMLPKETRKLFRKNPRKDERGLKYKNELITVYCRIKSSKKMYLLENQYKVTNPKFNSLENYYSNPNIQKIRKYNNEYSKDKSPLIILDSKNNSMIFEKNKETKKIIKNVIYKFDGIATPFKTQSDVFRTIAEPILQKLINKNMSTGMIFAYGYTNSGKTYSILGDTKFISFDTSPEQFFERESLGLLPRILITLIRNRKQQESPQQNDFFISDIKLSAFEIYKEKVYDLYFEDKPNKLLSLIKSKLRSKRKKNEVIKKNGKYDFNTRRILNIKDVLDALKFSESFRSVDDNGINKKSSRSHAIYKIEFKKIDNFCSNSQKIQEEIVTVSPKTSQKEIYIIDLAGAEKPNVEFKDRSVWTTKDDLEKKLENYMFDYVPGFRSATKARFHPKNQWGHKSLKGRL